MASLTALQNADDDALQAALPGLVAMAARTQHTFAYTLAVLRRLAAAPGNDDDDNNNNNDEGGGGGRVRASQALAAAAARVARELEQRAEQRVPATTVALRLGNVASAHSPALAAVALMTSANATNPSDIIQVRLWCRRAPLTRADASCTTRTRAHHRRPLHCFDMPRCLVRLM